MGGVDQPGELGLGLVNSAELTARHCTDAHLAA
jgi:hypothetical protein